MTGIDLAKALLKRQYKDASRLNARIALHARFSTNPEPWWGWVRRMMHLPADARILEVGTGPADFWRANLEDIPAGWEITLSDFSPGMLDQARTNLGPAQKRFAFARVNVVDIPFADETFDGVIANFMLYHAPDLDRAIAELHRVLKRGGRLYAATNGPGHMKQLNDLIQQLDPDAIIYAASSVFGLDNGADALHRHFPVANRYRYDDALRVTEREPLAAYAFSMDRSRRLSQHPESLYRAIDQQIEQEGAFFIEKRSGLFEAIKA
jgi:SAM-dependent methyltransferase